MTFNKRMLIKPAAALLVSAAILGYSVWKNREKENVPELAEMKQMLKTATAKDATADSNIPVWTVRFSGKNSLPTSAV